MSELSDYFEDQDEREKEWQCGNRSAKGDWCGKPIEHDGPHRTDWKAKVQAVWKRASQTDGSEC